MSRSTLSMSTFSEMCGFSNARAFNTRFRQKEGISPSKYRSDDLRC
ncbi:AraC family transcriptional regulator [Chamaesiphon sp. VAR_48_metabat_135_sub]